MSIQRILSQEVRISNDLFDIVETTGIDLHGNVWAWQNDHFIVGSPSPPYKLEMRVAHLELELTFKRVADGKS